MGKDGFWARGGGGVVALAAVVLLALNLIFLINLRNMVRAALPGATPSATGMAAAASMPGSVEQAAVAQGPSAAPMEQLLLAVVPDVVYECDARGEMQAARVRLWPAGGVAPYEILIMPVREGTPVVEEGYRVEAGEAFVVFRGGQIAYRVRSGTPDGQPKLTDSLFIPWSTPGMCDKRQGEGAPAVGTPPSAPQATATPVPAVPPSTPRPGLAECEDHIDNDGDKLVDMADPQCERPSDNHEDK